MGLGCYRGGGVGGWVEGVGDLIGFGIHRELLPEYVYPIAIFPLWPLYNDSMRRHPGSAYAPVCVAHQSYGYSTLDVPACPRVRFPPLGGQANGYPFQVCRCLNVQQSIHQGKKVGEVPALLEACLQVHLLLPPLFILQAILRCFP